jgi:hypothetical protein
MKWQSQMIPGTGPGGKPILSVLAKRTYVIEPGSTIAAEEQAPLEPSEIPGDPDNPFYSETRYESDLVAYKPTTDFVVAARAYAPRGKKAYRLECRVQAGPYDSKMIVHGNRRIESKMVRGLQFTDPEPFESRDIGYRYAFGGRAKGKDGTLYSYPTNPLGRGFHFKGTFEEYTELSVPHCENPTSPIEPDHLLVAKFEQWTECPKPISFGWTKPSFYPRYTYAGILPEMLGGAADAQAGIDPNTPKLDFRFYQGASDGLRGQVLQGNERVVLKYLDPQHPSFEFPLPGEKPSMAVTIGRDQSPVEPMLQTVYIDKENNLLSMVWRGSREYGGVEEFTKTLIQFEVAD